MSKRKYTNTSEVIEKYGDEISKVWENGCTLGYIADTYNLTRNTAVMILCDLGYPAPNWAKQIVEKRKERQEAKAAKRSKIG